MFTRQFAMLHFLIYEYHKHFWRLLKPVQLRAVETFSASCGGVAPVALVPPVSLVNNSFCYNEQTQTRRINYSLFWKMEVLDCQESPTEIAAWRANGKLNSEQNNEAMTNGPQTFIDKWQVVTGLCLTKIQHHIFSRLRNESCGFSALSSMGSCSTTLCQHRVFFQVITAKHIIPMCWSEVKLILWPCKHHFWNLD